MLHCVRRFLPLLLVLCMAAPTCDLEDAESSPDQPPATAPSSGGGHGPRGGPSQQAPTSSTWPTTGTPPSTLPPLPSNFPSLPNTTPNNPGTPSTSGTTGPTGSCLTAYTVATHIIIDVEWSGSLALAKGTGQVHLWSKSKFQETADSAVVMSRSCGSVLPPIQTSSLAGGYSVLPEIPDDAWEQPAMPVYNGTATRLAAGWQVSPGVALLGLTLTDPTVRWPDADKIMGVDVDGDGRLGITAYPRVGGRFQAPAVNLSQSEHAAELHLAIRSVMTLSSATMGCPQSYGGTADVTNFDSHVIGCRTTSGLDCDEGERDFVDGNRTKYEVVSGSFTSRRVADDISCGEIRTLLPIMK
ncbi:MAG: hypothetical protein RL701_7097 [Pseudomonadota bacterium]